MYKIYPTLLDSFIRYKFSVDNKDAALAKQELLNKINRVPEPEPPIVQQGKAFKKALDYICNEREKGTSCERMSGSFYFDSFEFDWQILKYFVDKLQYSIKEHFVTGVMRVDNYEVELYGYVDNIKEDVITDCKFVQNYDLAKYFSSMQRLVYPFCIQQQGGQISQFEFLATNNREIFSEVYNWKEEKDVPMLKKTVVEFVDFLEKHRSLITDKKVFGLV